MDARVERSTAPGDVLARIETAAPDRGWFELSPLNKRRLRAFKANRRGYYSFIHLHDALPGHAVRGIHRER